MGLIHTPRTIAAIGRGLMARRRNPKAGSSSSSSSPPSTAWIGMGPKHPHVYQARAGLFDVDYLGHMNNAAYLSHAEFARWELTAVNGLLHVMLQTKTNFLVAGCTVRYRREIRPLFRKFQIDSYVAGLDERTIWIAQNFRYPIESGRNRVRAQLIVQGVAMQQRTVLDPREFFHKAVGIDQDIIDELSLPNKDNNNNSSIQQDDETVMKDVMERYAHLDESLRQAAAKDDETHEGL